jgi:glutaredoxin
MAKIIVYSTEFCPWCVKLKEFLERNKMKYEMRMVDQNPKYAAELEEKSGQMGVPVIDVDGIVIIGYNEAALRKALKL